uniref:Putative secreted protein n=1 Tax=Ixodes ricinus TaxID=34613 RepID=A0A6B0UAE5_IXORI
MHITFQVPRAQVIVLSDILTLGALMCSSTPAQCWPSRTNSTTKFRGYRNPTKTILVFRGCLATHVLVVDLHAVFLFGKFCAVLLDVWLV